MDVVPIDDRREKRCVEVDREVWKCDGNSPVGRECRPVICCYCARAVYLLGQ
jgi:hypothetical protein